MRYTETGTIDPLHPALPGHFPGNPLVPGVLILARVLDAVAAAFGAKVMAVTVAKFHARLKPDERFTIELDRPQDELVKFKVVRNGTLIAGGVLRLRSAL